MSGQIDYRSREFDGTRHSRGIKAKCAGIRSRWVQRSFEPATVKKPSRITHCTVDTFYVWRDHRIPAQRLGIALEADSTVVDLDDAPAVLSQRRRARHLSDDQASDGAGRTPEKTMVGPTPREFGRRLSSGTEWAQPSEEVGGQVSPVPAAVAKATA